MQMFAAIVINDMFGYYTAVVIMCLLKSSDDSTNAFYSLNRNVYPTLV